ncbi:MAG: rRNA maturation RNase YbeY [Planctomycetaceae bacterium]|nr:rRNA maturation RNase YbeY [Planctomycetaceae bacterium]
MYQIDITHEHPTAQFDEAPLRRAVEFILKEARLTEATISVAIVDDPQIHEINRKFLQHDYPTDVISFVLESDEGRLEGEVIVSADTAATVAARLAWPVEHELLLYVVHGVLHLVGYDDLDPDSLREMRTREREVLAEFGIEVRYEQA